jgi:hypothetical protein
MVGGVVTLSSPDHIALITHALFNVSVPKTRMPEHWKFEEDVWVDGNGKTIEGELEFEVTQYSLNLGDADCRLITTSSILSMIGSLKHLS